MMVSYIIKENLQDWDTRPIPIEKLNTVINSFFLNNSVMILISKIIDIRPFIKKWKIYIRKYIHKKGKEFIHELLKYANTWDHYGISVMYLFMLHDFHWIIIPTNSAVPNSAVPNSAVPNPAVPNSAVPNNPKTKEKTNSFLFQYQSVLIDYILSIPEKRPTSTKIIEKIHHIGENINTKEYVQWIKQIIQTSELLHQNQNARFLETKEIEKRIENIVYGGYGENRKSSINV
jgi:hypothetical protein